MSLAEIEAELQGLAPDELRTLALKSWEAFLAKEGHSDGVNQCSEDDSRVIAALDAAIAEADSRFGQGHSAEAVRARLDQWTSK